MRAFFFAENLPRHNVRMVLHGRDKHFVARADVLAAVSLRDQIDGLGGASYKNNLARVGRIDELLDRQPRCIVRLGGAHAERVYAAMNIGIHVRVVIRIGIEHLTRLLRGCRVVKINEWPAVDPLTEDGKIGANLCEIEAGGSVAQLRIAGHGLGGSRQRTSSQCCTSSSSAATDDTTVWRLRANSLIRSRIRPSANSRAAGSCMRSRHSAAKA